MARRIAGTVGTGRERYIPLGSKIAERMEHDASCKRISGTTGTGTLVELGGATAEVRICKHGENRLIIISKN